MRKKIDLHIHTVASDGEITLDEILQCAKLNKIKEISITDHDALGAYTREEIDPFKKAMKMGIVLIPGIELDSGYPGVEVHVLGYEIDIYNNELGDYLSRVQGSRRKRIKEQIEQINKAFKKEIIKEEEIFLPGRDTLMKPHLIRLLIEKEIFSEYREASQWLSSYIKPATTILKPSSGEMIRLVKRAGGRAFLAHPGYYMLENGISIDKMLEDLLPYGLDGLEVEYPYFNTGTKFQDKETEIEIIHKLGEVARKNGLDVSRGSDAHNLEQMKAFSFY